MANIPGISGYVQPGVFARDRVRSTSASIPGGLRTLVLMGEGIKEVVLVASAEGSGLDGVPSISPSGEAEGRYFKIPESPLVSGRTELRLNGTLLFGTQKSITSGSLSSKFDYRIDISNGNIELQGASIRDQDGKGYVSGARNVGSGVLVETSCGEYNTLDILDSSTPAETWTLTCTAVTKDQNGAPIAGTAKFKLEGSVSGLSRDSSSNPLSFSDTYHTAGDGAISGSSSPDQGYPVVKSTSFSDATPVLGTSSISNVVELTGDLVSDGQGLVGDYLILNGYSAQEITAIVYDSSTLKTTITVKSAVYTAETPASWEIKATNLFVAEHESGDIDGDGIDDGYLSAGPFSSADIGKIISICGGDSAGLYLVKQVTSSRRARVHKYGDPSAAFPSLDAGSLDLAEVDLTYHLLETNDVLMLGIKPGVSPFSVGDKFRIIINSRVLKKGDSLVAKYIYELDVNDPEVFSNFNDIKAKHGEVSTSNTITLGAQLAFANGAGALKAIQCKPSLPRRTSTVLVEERNSSGEGGLTACGGSADDCEVDDLLFPIPVPISGLRQGKPDSDTQVNIFITRNGSETQIFPNKVEFYNSQLETETQQNNFISSSNYDFSYTIVNTDVEILGSGDDGSIFNDSSDAYFSTASFDFDGKNVTEETVIVVTSMEVVGSSGNTLLTSKEDIAQALFGSSSAAAGVELVVDSIINDNLVTVVSKEKDGLSNYTFESNLDIENIQFFIKDEEDTTNQSAALLLNKDLISSGTIRDGDGLRISYIDRNDADFFDVNWLDAFDKLESHDAQIIVPLPSQTKTNIFRAAVNHCELMSSIANKKERVALIGAIQGVDDQALLGNKLVAIEDIGVIEGIQGDDPEEILSGDIEDLVNFKLDENFTSNRCSYFYPDQIVVNVAGTNTFMDGFYIAAAAGGRLAATTNVAVPLTNKTLSGFSILNNKLLKSSFLNDLGSIGATVLQPITGGGRILASRTTSNSGFVEDEELSIIFIRDRVKQVLRSSMKSYIGRVQSSDTITAIEVKMNSIMNGLVAQGIITEFSGLRVAVDKVDPRQLNVYVGFVPAYPVNYVFIEIEVGVQ